MPTPLKELFAIALPILRDNIDTDALIPVSENTRLSTTGFGDALFASWRYSDRVARIPDPGFILNRPPFDQAKILIAGRNLGCGSSRESAVWALRDYGFRVLIAASFNEIFSLNCITNGIAPLVMSGPDIAQLAQACEEDPERGVGVNLQTLEVQFGQPSSRKSTLRFSVTIDPYHEDLLLSGHTEETLLAQQQAQIQALRLKRSEEAPWITQP